MRKQVWIIAAVALLQAGVRGEELGAGKLLVASRDLLDPNFAQTVVLLVRYDDDSVLGLIINRRTQIPLARVFPELKEAKGQADPIYRGGPVERTAALALLRAPTKPEEAEHIFANVSMISSRALLDKTIAERMDPSMFHVYLGYAGWTKRQLQGEVELGAWRIFPGNAAAVFDPDPETLWARLIRKTEERIAWAAEGVIYTNANHRSFVNRHYPARPRAQGQKERSAARAEKS
jgi:putative transcriptional regulator